MKKYRGTELGVWGLSVSGLRRELGRNIVEGEKLHPDIASNSVAC